MIPYGRQDVTAEDIEAVIGVLSSDFLTQGEQVCRFEEVVRTKFGARHAVAVNSATSALHLACLAIDLRPGDYLWTSPISFVASSNCGLYCGAGVDFVDIDPVTWNICADALEEKLRIAARKGTVPKVVVSVHFAGLPPAQERIRRIANEYGCYIIEDASHAIGAKNAGEYVGSCKWSDVTVFSFHPVKIVTTGEGGMALTNDAALADRMRDLRSHGITRDPKRFRSARDNGAQETTAGGEVSSYYYEMHDLGFNYRITDFQCALGSSQFERLDSYMVARNRIAGVYSRELAHHDLQLPVVSDDMLSAFHLYVILIPEEARRNAIFAELRSAGIGVNFHYIPIYKHPYYRGLGFSFGACPAADDYAKRAITLPIFPKLSENEQTFIIDTLGRILCK